MPEARDPFSVERYKWWGVWTADARSHLAPRDQPRPKVKCQICGGLVPLNQIVEWDGRLICAECNQKIVLRKAIASGRIPAKVSTLSDES